MDEKYIVVYQPPAYVHQVVEAAYARVTGRPLPVRHIHLSMAFGFYLRDGYPESWLKHVVSSLVFEPISATLGSLAVFEQMGKKILYLHVEPSEALGRLYHTLNQSLKNGIDYDYRVFDGGVMPPFLPHITLDYDFDGDQTTFEGLVQERIAAYFTIDQLTAVRVSSDAWIEL